MRCCNKPIVDAATLVSPRGDTDTDGLDAMSGDIAGDVLGEVTLVAIIVCSVPLVVSGTSAILVVIVTTKRCLDI